MVKKKRLRTLVSLLLAVVLIFSIASVFASATVNKSGTVSSLTKSSDGVSMTGRVVCYTNKAVAHTSITESGATITAHACFTYYTPASPHFTVDEKKIYSATATYVSVAANNPDTSLYTAKYGYGGHDENKYGIPHIETRDAP